MALFLLRETMKKSQPRTERRLGARKRTISGNRLCVISAQLDRTLAATSSCAEHRCAFAVHCVRVANLSDAAGLRHYRTSNAHHSRHRHWQLGGTLPISRAKTNLARDWISRAATQ